MSLRINRKWRAKGEEAEMQRCAGDYPKKSEELIILRLSKCERYILTL